MNVGKVLFGQGVWGSRVVQESLDRVNPFRLATEGRPDPQLTIVVAGIQLPDGRGGFVLLASRNDPSSSLDQLSAEDFLDPSCSS